MIACQQSSDQNKARVQRRERLRNLSCEVENCLSQLTTDKSSTAVEEVTKTPTGIGYTLEPSQGRIIIIEFIYLLITIVGF